jgi:AcrR family transcriptional regulator
MPRRTLRSAERRVEILKSAAAAFRRRGYHGASVEEIARALKMTKGSLYYYFRDKQDILFGCHEYSLGVALDLLERVEAEALPPDEKLRRLIVGFVHLIIDELHGTGLTLELEALPRPLLRKVVARRDRFDRGLRKILQDGMDQGLFAPGDAKLLAFALMGALNWISRWYDPRGEASSDEIATTFANYLVGGLAGVRSDV